MKLPITSWFRVMSMVSSVIVWCHTSGGSQMVDDGTAIFLGMSWLCIGVVPPIEALDLDHNTRNHGYYRQFYSKFELLRRYNRWHQLCWHHPLRYSFKDTTHFVNLYRGVVPPIDTRSLLTSPETIELQPDYRRFYSKFKMKRAWHVTPTLIIGLIPKFSKV